MADDVRGVIEAALFVSGRILTLDEISRICESGNAGLIRQALAELKQEYSSRNSGIEIYEYDSGYGMRIRADVEPSVMHLASETEIPPAMLKTLALIAYEQPVMQSKLVKERGTRVYKYVKMLREQELIEAKRKGRTRILTVTPKFKEYFQVQDVKDLVKAEEKDRGELSGDVVEEKDTKDLSGDEDVAAD